MSPSELRAAVEDLQRLHPELTRGGYDGIPSPLNLEAVAWCVDWLKDAPSGKRATISSYALKHLAENLRGREQGGDPYVGNGDLIAAAKLVGIPVKRTATGPNARIQLKGYWVAAQYRKVNGPER